MCIVQFHSNLVFSAWYCILILLTLLIILVEEFKMLLRNFAEVQVLKHLKQV